MLKLIDHQMQRIDSFEKTLMLGKIEGRRRIVYSFYFSSIVLTFF